MTNLRYKIKSAGGWLQASGKVAQTFRCEGLIGLRRRLAIVMSFSLWDYSRGIGCHGIFYDDVSAKLFHVVDSEAGLTVGLHFVGW